MNIRVSKLEELMKMVFLLLQKNECFNFLKNRDYVLILKY